MQKKVLITISRGLITRNLLQNDFFTLLRENYTVVLLTQAYEDERFINEFSHPNVSFKKLIPTDRTLLDRVLYFFHKHLIYNSTVNQKNRWGIIGDPRSKKPPYTIYILRQIVFIPLSKIPALRDLARWIDLKISQKKERAYFDQVLDEEKPDMVISSNVADDTEAALLKSANEKGIYTIAMPKSWDNPNKAGFRVKVDTIICWNDLMADQMMKYQNYKKENIGLIGVPQYDYYLDESRIWSREKFCELYNLDPNKKILLFTSEGKLFKVNDAEIASVLYDAIEKKKLREDCQLLIRPHWGYKEDAEKFKHVSDKPGVSLDLINDPAKVFRDEWDYSLYSMDRFLNMIYHADININTHSSLTLDSACFDKPVISIMFDGFEHKPYHDSIRRWYETEYYKQILSFKATIETKSPEDLVEAINTYLADPSYKHEERMKLRDVFCYKFDGKAGERFYNLVNEKLQ